MAFTRSFDSSRAASSSRISIPNGTWKFWSIKTGNTIAPVFASVNPSKTDLCALRSIRKIGEEVRVTSVAPRYNHKDFKAKIAVQIPPELRI